MRNCRKYEEILARFLHGEVLLQEREELEGHLAMCSSCERLYRDATDADLVLRDLPGKMVDPPGYLRARILASLPEVAPQPFLPVWRRWAVAVGGVIACALFAFVLYRDGGPKEARLASVPSPVPKTESILPAIAAPVSPRQVSPALEPGERIAKPAPQVQIIREVRIYFYYPAAQKVAVTGDFNGWDSGGVPLRRSGKPGLWETDLRLKPGAYSYNFVVDGETLVPDPNASNQAPDGYGGTNSILLVKGEKPA